MQVCGAVVRTEIIDQGPAGTSCHERIDVDASVVEDIRVREDLVGIVAVDNPTRRPWDRRAYQFQTTAAFRTLLSRIGVPWRFSDSGRVSFCPF